MKTSSSQPQIIYSGPPAEFAMTNRAQPPGILLVVMLLALLTAGCASRHAIEPQNHDSKEKAEIERTLREVFTAAETKDFELLDSLHAYGPKFTKFTDSSAERLDAAASREEEHVSLGSLQGLRMRAEALKIDVFGGVAVTTFILECSFNSEGATALKKAASTLVFVKQDGTWKIYHEHFSPLQP